MVNNSKAYELEQVSQLMSSYVQVQDKILDVINRVNEEQSVEELLELQQFLDNIQHQLSSVMLSDPTNYPDPIKKQFSISIEKGRLISVFLQRELQTSKDQINKMQLAKRMKTGYNANSIQAFGYFVDNHR